MTLIHCWPSLKKSALLKKKVIMERHAFNTRDQMDEGAQSYIPSLRILASS